MTVFLTLAFCMLFWLMWLLLCHLAEQGRERRRQDRIQQRRANEARHRAERF